MAPDASMEARPPEKPFAYILVKRVALFFLVVSLFPVLFWAAGNWSRFLDDTQLMLIGIVRWSSTALLLLSVLGVFLCLFRAWKRGPGARLLALLGYLLLACLGLVFILLSQFLSAVVSGS
jgi:peptidoglycan/LPS O-acetylase OafA/YrhL